MHLSTRKEIFQKLFPSAPVYRLKQLEAAIFDSKNKNWNDVSVFSPAMRHELQNSMPWMTVQEKKKLTNAKHDTIKAALELADGNQIESVLMQNARGKYTLCVSSQVGCAMRCRFCATGRMGLVRDLSEDEIIDQYRFWTQTLPEHAITNIVFMGMGEPLANYDAVKSAVQILIKHTDIGPTKVTISTVGVIHFLEKFLHDETWPHVRLAISLHSADEAIRKKIVPTSVENFLSKLSALCHEYLAKHGNRRHHITFEYVMLDSVNDSADDAKKLADYVKKIGHVRVNLIPYNITDNEFQQSKRVSEFQQELKAREVDVTVRKTMGEDIAAACGQLIIKK